MIVARPSLSQAVVPRVALLLGVLSAVVLGHYVVTHPAALHLDVAITPVMGAAAVAALSLCILILRRTDFALALLVATVYLNLSHVLVRQGFPSLLQLTAVPLVLAALASRPPEEWVRLATRPLTWLLVAYTLVLLGSTTYARAPELADARVSETVKALLIYLMIVLFASSIRRVYLAAWTMLAAGTLLAGLGVLRIVGVRIPGVSDGLARFELAHIYGTLFEPRITGPLGDANFFAQILLVLVPVGLCLAWGARRPWQRLAGYASVAVLGAATVLTYSRGGALALGFVLVLALVAHGISWKRLAAGGTVLLVVWTVALPAEFTARLATVRQFLPGATTEGRRDSSFEERLLLTGTAWEMFVENAAVGVGAGNYTARFSEYAQRFGSAAHDYHDPAAPRYPHNLLLEVGAETGAVGLSVFAGALLAAFLALGRVGGRDSPPEAHALRGLARAFQIALAGYLVSSLFLHGDFQRYLWLLLGMAGALDAMVAPARSSRRRLETQDATAPDGAAPDHTPVARHGAGGPPTARRGIAVLLSRFPSVTETFILREVIEMERQGQPVLLVPLLRESPPVVHREAVPWVRRALYTPFVSPAILAANLRAVLRHPIRYVTVVARVVVGTLRSPRIALGTLGIIPKSIYLAERIRAEGIRHVHAHFATHPTTAALIISALTGASFSFTIHAHDLFSRRYRPLLPLKLRRAAFVRVISRYNRDHLQRLYPDVPLEKVHVVHVGIEPELYAGDADREPTVLAVPSPAAAPPPVRLLSVAALRDYKGLPVLLEACRRLRRDGVAVQCDVVGEGPMRPQLERMIRELELESCARLLGAKPQDEVRRLLAEQPIFVLSSVVLRDGWMEGIPVALMEAMASGCAVISSRLSGIPELVESGVTGMLVEPGDAGALADAIRAVASDPGRARRLGAGGRAMVDAAFRLDRTVTELLSLVDAHNGFEAPPVLQAAVGQIRPAADAAPVGIRRVHHGSDALALELMVPTTTGAPSEVVLKVHREHARASRPAAERAHNEWTALKMFQSGWRPLWNAVGVTAPRLGVPLPVHCAIDEGWLVMETCTGRNLSHVVRSARAGRDAREWSATVSALRAAGQWLRGFQRQPGTGQDPDVALMAWDAAVEADIRRCSSVVPDHLWRSARDRLGELTIAVAPHLSHGVLQHGDFGPGNVFVEEGRVQVIDFEGVRPGLPYEDVAYFVVQLELFFAWPLLGGRRLEAVSAFLAGYLDGDALNESAYRMARIAKALQVLGRPRRAGPLDYAGHRRHRALRRMLADAAA